MTMKDLTGRYRSFLATEGGFAFVKEMQTNNLIVPVVGDFGGPSAMYRVGDYVRAHKDRIHVLYASPWRLPDQPADLHVLRGASARCQSRRLPGSSKATG